MFKIILIAAITLSFHSAKAENNSGNLSTDSEAVANLAESREIASESSETVQKETNSAETADNTSAVVPADQPTSENNSTEAVVEVAAPAANESNPSNTAVAEENKPEAPKLAELGCQDMFLQWVRQQPIKTQDKYLETYFQRADGYAYRNDKQDEFVWSEKEAVYKKQFKDLLAQGSKAYVLRADVVLGKYDFKKKGFPVEIKYSKDGTLENTYSGGSLYTSFARRTPDAGQIICSGGLDEDKFPSSLVVGIQKIQGPKFLPVTEEQGKMITANLNSSRQVTSEFEVDVVSLSAKPTIYNKKLQYFAISTKLKKASITIGGETFDYKF